MDLSVRAETAGVTLGAPGVYVLPQVAAPDLVTEPLDVAAFVGVAPRGPAWEPVSDPTLAERGTTRARSVAVSVDSWDGYMESFGAFEGPGLLPYAVASFFAQGGRRAFVVRVVHDEAVRDQDGLLQPLGCALHELPGPAAPGAPTLVEARGGGRVRLRARNEGTWGNKLQISLSFSVRYLPVENAEPAALVLAAGAQLPVGSVVRVHGDGGLMVLRRVVRSERRGSPRNAAVNMVATLDAPPGFTVARAEEILAELSIIDGDPLTPRTEVFAGLGLSQEHPRWLADQVTANSRLIEVAGAVSGAGNNALISPLLGIEIRDLTLPSVASSLQATGEDRWGAVTPADVFGRLLEGDDAATEGLDALLHAQEVASLVVPDLYSPAPVRPAEPVVEDGVFTGPAFAPCLRAEPVRHPPVPDSGLAGLRLDPRDPDGLQRILYWQQQLVQTAERLRVVALLDVPPGLRHRAVLAWRSRFDSSWAAAYHPWLRSPAGPGLPLRDIPPSAAAAGIIARCERRSGVPRGPANEPASGVVDVADRLDDARHDELHLGGVNVFRREPDAVWLTGARSLSGDRQLRHLTVRRLLQLVERALERQLAWTVFEPNDDALRAGLRRMIDHLLEDLFAHGAFAGATPAQSWFVHVAAGPALAVEADAGQVIAEIGLALTVPMEYILVRVTLDAAGNVDARGLPGAEVTVHG